MCLIGKPVTGCYTIYQCEFCYFEYTTVVKKDPIKARI